MDKKMKVQKVKGRAMLHWVGKKPIEVVEGYPAQLVETVGVKDAPASPNFAALENDWSNLLFHGDNKEVLSTLLVNGFRGKVDLIYIDPPFDSGADYVRKVELRGVKGEVNGEEHNELEQLQYEDIWANDNYLQFMYERLILLRELLSENGSIYLHCDWHKNHYLRMLMDEVFGQDNFFNEVVWHYKSFHGQVKNYFPRKHDTIIAYSKTTKPIFYLTRDEGFPIEQMSDYKNWGKYIVNGNEIRGNNYPRDVRFKRYLDKWMSDNSKKVPSSEDVLYVFKTQPFDDTWDINYLDPKDQKQRTDYPTQKPEELLERIIKSSSNPDSIVLDCFIGSGTTAAAAQKLGRRWIGADINKGAIQTTMKRLQKVVGEQTKDNKIIDDEKPASTSMLHYRVNNYDFQEASALKQIITEKYGVETLKTDVYFDGTVGTKLVKIAELNRPVTKLDVQGIIDELKNRPEEDRDILLIGSGVELGVATMLAERRQLKGAPNQIEVKDIQADGVIVADPAEADVDIVKSGGKVNIAIKNYISPTIIKRLDIDRSIFGERIKDFRAQIDVVLVDTNYDGKTFNITFSDVPARKQDLVQAKYELELPKTSKKVAVKIIDMLGEETLAVV